LAEAEFYNDHSINPPLTQLEFSMTTAPNSSSVAQELDNVISTALALNRIVGTVIMVAREGEIVYERAAGFADREVRRSARPDTIFRLASLTKPIAMRDTGFSISDSQRLAAAYFDAVPAPARMKDQQIVPFPPGAGLSFAPDRILDPNSYPSGGGGMAGTAEDFLVFLETLRKGGSPILRSETVATMTSNQIGDFMIDPERPGWGFGFGA
jgi:CubicO group peptidase (beta-lactamase class C family)